MVENTIFEIEINKLAVALLNARNLVAEISEILYYAKEEKENN
jgi:hypothetical protein